MPNYNEQDLDRSYREVVGSAHLGAIDLIGGDLDVLITHCTDGKTPNGKECVIAHIVCLHTGANLKTWIMNKTCMSNIALRELEKGSKKPTAYRRWQGIALTLHYESCKSVDRNKKDTIGIRIRPGTPTKAAAPKKQLPYTQRIPGLVAAFESLGVGAGALKDAIGGTELAAMSQEQFDYLASQHKLLSGGEITSVPAMPKEAQP